MVRNALEQLVEMAAQPGKPVMRHEARLVQVQRAVDLDLQAVAPARRVEYAVTSSAPLYGQLMPASARRTST
ncbi:hypothetical protein [Cupriavidus sp. IK-TO18]|uniref:hypothetical protein n=1 Tax=Cupriavidus sp. IK-TO18 TaxID=2782182 RepID=UPI00189853B1|nr:hypothetical protein [Cupriavidus sp. IK-TO18]MBF6989838.1 hypothetical protein [Cupriavidus sp. IK-TO18]